MRIRCSPADRYRFNQLHNPPDEQAGRGERFLGRLEERAEGLGVGTRLGCHWAPSRVRMQPEIFWFTLIMRMSCSPWLLVKGTLGSTSHRQHAQNPSRFFQCPSSHGQGRYAGKFPAASLGWPRMASDGVPEIAPTASGCAAKTYGLQPARIWVMWGEKSSGSRRKES